MSEAASPEISNSIGVNSFDRSKKFYPIVMHYLALYFGARDLAVAGTVGSRNADSVLSGLFGSQHAPEIQTQMEELKKGLSKLVGPLQLKSEFQGNYIQVEVDDIAKEFANNFGYLIDFVNSAAGFALTLAYTEGGRSLSEAQKATPLWQFLRYCRHANAHNGRLEFRNGSPDTGVRALDRSRSA